MNANQLLDPIPFIWESSAGNSILFIRDGDTATSLPSAPYAGILTSPIKGHNEEMIDAMLALLKKKNIKNVVIKQRPDFLIPHTDTLHKSLVDFGFEVTTDTNHHVQLSELESIQIHSMQKRRIKKCEREGFTFKKESLDQSLEVYDFLVQCRSQQNLEINIERKKFFEVTCALPEHYELYSVKNDQGELVAATVVVIVNNKVVYNYLPGFDRTYHDFSPLAFLSHNLYSVLSQRQFEHFDLGVSSVNGVIQTGLAQFKERMGGIVGLKYTYHFSSDKS